MSEPLSTPPPVRGWHFLTANRRLGYNDGRTVIDGETLTQPDLDRQPELCVYGMHASREVWQALPYAPGAVLCRVVVSGEVVEGSDKLVGRSRRVLWSLPEATTLPLIVKYARWCAKYAADATAVACYAAGYAAADAAVAANAARSADAAHYAAAAADYAADAAHHAAAAAAASARAAACSAATAAFWEDAGKWWESTLRQVMGDRYE